MPNDLAMKVWLPGGKEGCVSLLVFDNTRAASAFLAMLVDMLGLSTRELGYCIKEMKTANGSYHIRFIDGLSEELTDDLLDATGLWLATHPEGQEAPRA